MFPEKHFEDLESSQRRRSLIKSIGVSLIFIASFLFIGPVLHEAFHILPLEFIGCPYSFELNFQLIGGIYASVQPLCHPSDSFLSIFYLAGYTSSFIAGWGLLVLASRLDRNFDRYMAAAGTGVLLSILPSTGYEGDISSFLKIIGMSEGLEIPVYLLLTLAVFMISFSGIKILLEDQKGRKETLRKP